MAGLPPLTIPAMDASLGLETDPWAYVGHLVSVFRLVRERLAEDGTLWLNLGDSYANSALSKRKYRPHLSGSDDVNPTTRQPPPQGLKPKDLFGIPWRVAFALQADGWWLRSDVVWCLSGGMWLYAKTDEGGITLTTIKDLARLKPGTVSLWNGSAWTCLLGISKSARKGNEIELVLRSGERISCTPTHRFPTQRGLLPASDILCGDILQWCILPEPDAPRDCVIDEDAAWFAGLYLAEGSMAGDTIQIAGHVKESARWERVRRISEKFGGSATKTEDKNNQVIRVYGKVLVAILNEIVTGRTAKNKGFSPSVWRYSNAFVAAMVDGYLSGDGYDDSGNNRWRLGFCRNYNLERDLRTACARLGYILVLNLSSTLYKGRKVPTFHGELRKVRSGHHNEKDRAEVTEIRKARCREVYDIGVESDQHLFAFASGILTHNSKPNPMPESVTDRPTKAHEMIFLLSKSARYFFGQEAVSEKSAYPGDNRALRTDTRKAIDPFCKDNRSRERTGNPTGETRNLRTVWTIATESCPDAHFAVMPSALAERCILAGSEVDDTVLDPFAGAGTTLATARRLGRVGVGCELNPEYIEILERQVEKANGYRDIRFWAGQGKGNTEERSGRPSLIEYLGWMENPDE